MVLLTAYQEQRVQKAVALLSNLALQIIRIAVLAIWKSYYVYLAVTVLGTVANTMFISAICNKIHPELQKISRSNEIPFDKKTVLDRVKYTFPYKVGAVIINSTDNILISVLVNTTAIGLYSNYLVIVTALQGFISTITTSITGSLGNLCAQDMSRERQLAVFRTMLLFYHMVGALGGIVFIFLLDDFISLWLGNQYVMGKAICFAIALSFYLTNALSPIWMFREANGLFREVRFLLLTTAGCNIVFSILLGKLFGVFGILLATSISRIITQLWYEPSVLFKNVFVCSSKIYWGQQLRYFVTTAASFVISFWLIPVMPGGYTGFALKIIVIMTVIGTFFIATNLRTEEFRTLRAILVKSIPYYSRNTTKLRQHNKDM